MEDTHLRLPVALIINYKRSTQAKKNESCHPRNKLQRKTKEKHKSRERLKADRGEIAEINWKSVLLILFLFLLIHGDVFDG